MTRRSRSNVGSHRKKITEAAQQFGLDPAAWLPNQEGGRLLRAGFGRWRALRDLEDHPHRYHQPRFHPIKGKEGELHALVIGSKRHQRVAFFFTADGTQDSVEVEPYTDVEPV